MHSSSSVQPLRLRSEIVKSDTESPSTLIFSKFDLKLMEIGPTPIVHPRNKRRKVCPAEKTAIPHSTSHGQDRILLIERVLFFDLGVESASRLTEGVNSLLQPADVTSISVDLELIQKDQKNPHMRIYQKGSSQLLFTLDIVHDDFSESITDFAWVSEMRDDSFLRKPLLQDHYLSTSILEFVQQKSERGSPGQWNMQLETKVSVRPADSSYSEYGFQLSRTKWWELLARTLPIGCPDGSNNMTVSTREFYSSVHVPLCTEIVPGMIQSPDLVCKLMPFQQRAIRWMLQREGVDLHPEKHELIPHVPGKAGDQLPPTFFENIDRRGNTVYVSHVLGAVCKDLNSAYDLTKNIRGGILAEEMGLGKTVESIGLICLHRRELVPGELVQDRTRGRIKASRATLIVTPPSIIHQWQTEFEKHAPNLKIFVYEGIRRIKDGKPIAKIIEEMLKYDVVVTTYSVLASEIHYTKESPDRKYRNQKIYEPKRSPLVEVSWWRVLLDEAQMIEGGYSNAARVARDIPRINCWAVSGTPIKKDINDCYGLLLFLKYEPFATQKDAWQRLSLYNHQAFKSLFKSLTLRHSKDLVRNEINLPPQHRIVVTVPFSHVEEQNYRWLFYEMCKDCGLDEEGAPKVNDWDIEEHYEKMRHWLTRLRQTCLHPEAGSRNRKALGNKNGPVRTVEEVLQVMIDKQIAKLRTDQREMYAAKTRRGQLYDQDKQHETALMVWHETLGLIQATVAECREALEEELKNDQDKVQTEDLDGSRVSIARQRIHGFLELEHSCYFWIATANHQLKERADAHEGGKNNQLKKEEYSAKELEYYERAKKIRLELTSVTRSKASRFVAMLEQKTIKRQLTVVPEVQCPEDAGGIEVQTTMSAVDELAEVLNEQANLLREWRDKAVTLLIEPLFDSDKGEANGTENEKAVEDNEEAYAYITAIRGLLADREELFTGQKNTNIAMKVTDLCENKEFIHQHKFRYLVAKKSRLNPFRGMKNMKTLINDLRTHINDMADENTTRASAEAAVASEILKDLREINKVQTEACTDFFKETDLMISTLNSRIDFYRQVQIVSDTLLAVDIAAEFRNGLSEAVFVRLEAKEVLFMKTITKDKAKIRYLNHLKTAKVERSPDCLICTYPYEFGTITSCGHSFCTDCIEAWYKNSRTCPDCRSNLHRNDLFHITYLPKEIELAGKTQELHLGSSAPLKPAETSLQIYSNVDDKIFRDIKNIDLKVQYGSKIDAITRHLLWLKQNERGYKAVIFSQWSDVLEVIREAFIHADIGYASLAQKDGIDKFREDPDVSCFLLHAKSQSAGLTLVNATHVFLCEPLVNIPLELQAVSRVHRIGQTKPTTVWVYIVDNSVEQAVMKLAMSRRIEMIAKDADGDVEMELDAADSDKLKEGVSGLVEKIPGGGEVVHPKDLWNCLFGAGTSEKLKGDDRTIQRELMAGAAEMRMEVTRSLT